MAKKRNGKSRKKIDYKEKMSKTLQTILDLQNREDIQTWFRGVSGLMRFGRNYSPGNLLLVHAQKRDAIWTEGFHSWKTKYKRSVQKGEKGILIFAPNPVKKKENDDSNKDTKRNHTDLNEGDGPSFVLFKPVYVWDYSQTKGEKARKIEALLEKRNAIKNKIYAASGDNLKELSSSMRELSKGKGIAIASKDLGLAGGMAKGTTIYIDKSLAVGEDLDVLIHEFSHIMLGHTKGKWNTSEIELAAELTVGLVKSGLGLDIKPQAAYLYDWSRDANAALREEKFMTAFNASQPLANEILNHLFQPVAADDDAQETACMAA